MDEQIKYERIESYLDGSMTSDERLQFEQDLAENSSLAEEVELHQKLHNSLRGEKIHQFRTALKEVDQQWQQSSDERPQNHRFRRIFRPALALAASVVLLLIVWQLLSPYERPEASEQQFAAYFEPYQMVLNQRSADEFPLLASTLNRAITQYAEGRFAEAAMAFDSLEQSDPGNIAFQFYRSQALLASGQTKEAIPVLKSILNIPGHLFSEQCRWYLALAYLKMGQEAEAKGLLEGIEPHQFHYTQSQELLEY